MSKNEVRFLERNEHFRFASLSEEQRNLLLEADRECHVEAKVNNKWYLKTNVSFADNGIYRIKK